MKCYIIHTWIKMVGLKLREILYAVFKTSNRSDIHWSLPFFVHQTEITKENSKLHVQYIPGAMKMICLYIVRSTMFPTLFYRNTFIFWMLFVKLVKTQSVEIWSFRTSSNIYRCSWSFHLIVLSQENILLRVNLYVPIMDGVSLHR